MYGTKPPPPHFTQMMFTMSTHLQKHKTIVQRAMLFMLAEHSFLLKKLLKGQIHRNETPLSHRLSQDGKR